MDGEAQAVEQVPKQPTEPPLSYERCSCLRCGHDWKARNPNHRPTGCPRCGSALWDKPPMHANARRPSDPPNPNWRFRSKPIRRKCPTCGRPMSRLTVKERLKLEAKERERLEQERMAAEAEVAASERPVRPVAPTAPPREIRYGVGPDNRITPQPEGVPRRMTPPPSMRRPLTRPQSQEAPETQASRRTLSDELEEKTR